MASPAIPSAKPATGRIRLEVVTPSGMVLSESVDEFTAPSVQGQFGVLPGHVPLLAALQIGLLSFRKASEKTECAVGRGFVEIADDYALVLTDRYAGKDKVDGVSEVRAKLKEIDEQLDRWSEERGSPKHKELIAEEQWQAVLLELGGEPPVPTLRAHEEYQGEDRSGGVQADQPVVAEQTNDGSPAQ